MKILAIETSCDETAIAILECSGDQKSATFKILGNSLLSQIEIHKKYGGVFPFLAKREHAKNLVPILFSALEEANLLNKSTQTITEETRAKISEILARESGLAEAFFEFVSKHASPGIDAIAVTAGPGLEPALWVGINFAKALAFAWNKPLVAVNHMEGHVLAALARRESGEQFSISNLQFPILALLISGGHTELIVMKRWLEYELVGQTRDDAVGEAFDKVARMLELPYPGGPEISRLAEHIRSEQAEEYATGLPNLVQGIAVHDQTAEFGSGNALLDLRLPRPMIDSGTCDFSFAGLKTAVLYLLKGIPNVSEDDKKHIAHEFENAVADVLWKKTADAIEKTGAKTLVIGGGVSANTHIKRVFINSAGNAYSRIELRIPAPALSTDNAVMIALAGYYRALREEFSTDFKANGNLSLI